MLKKMFCTFCVKVRTISRACGSHVQEGEQVLLLQCPPMRYSDAMAHELQKRQARKINRLECNVCYYKEWEFSSLYRY